MVNLDKILKDFTIRVGYQIVQTAKEKTAPIRTGNLKRDIQIINYDKSSVTIGNTQTAPYAKHVYFGTRPHVIEAKNKKCLANKRLNKVFGKRVYHPGTKANPYLLNAVQIYFKSGDFNLAKRNLTAEVKDEILKEVRVKFKK